MTRYHRVLGGVVLFYLTSGCALEELRSKNNFGVEWRHIASRTQDDERYTIQPGLEFKWDKGVTTGIAFRSRPTNEGQGTDDNGIFTEISFPLWKRPKPEVKTAEHIRELEDRIRELEAVQARLTSAILNENGPVELGSEARVAQAVGGSESTGQN